MSENQDYIANNKCKIENDDFESKLMPVFLE